MAKQYLRENVYEASLRRIAYIFDEFENVLVAFSGGKDSGVCLNLCYDYAKEHELLDKLAMYHMDYEAQYQMTTDYVTETFERFNDIKRFWLCLPVAADCSCRMDAGTWTVWERNKKDLWVRDMPEYEYVITEDNCPFKMYEGQLDYDVQENFCCWFGQKFGKTAVIIGIRTTESLNRYRAIKSDKKVNVYKHKSYLIAKDHNTINAYPIYDWETSDIWVYNARFKKPYNRLYDLYFQAGLSIEQMRVANPFHSCGTETLRLYKVIDPVNWGKMVSRVNGVCFAGIYGGTTAMGWKSITKPSHFTWKEYCYFLLDTLPPKLKAHYLEKLNTSIAFWRDKGGCLDDETIAELKDENIEFINRGNVSKISNKSVISFDDYLDDTSCQKFSEIPTYKRMCVCIMKNDYYCVYMGFGKTKEAMERRKQVISKYQSL